MDKNNQVAVKCVIYGPGGKKEGEATVVEKVVRFFFKDKKKEGK